jgi:hypothetical protein
MSYVLDVFFCHSDEGDPRAMLEPAKQISISCSRLLGFLLRRNDK